MPEDKTTWQYWAKRVAEAVLDGSTDPNDGCAQLGVLAEQSGYPDGLNELYHLAHIQDGHDDLGFNRENLSKEIMVAMQELLITLKKRT